MAASVEEIMISYEELSDLENEFDDVETEISKLEALERMLGLSPEKC